DRGELVHAPGKQRQAQALQPCGAIAVAISVRKAIRILAVLSLGTQLSLKGLKTRLGQDHLEAQDRQSLLSCIAKHGGVVEDDPGIRTAISQIVHHLPAAIVAAVGVEAINSLARIGRNTCMPCEEQALGPRRAGATALPLVVERPEESLPEWLR